MGNASQKIGRGGLSSNQGGEEMITSYLFASALRSSHLKFIFLTPLPKDIILPNLGQMKGQRC